MSPRTRRKPGPVEDKLLTDADDIKNKHQRPGKPVSANAEAIASTEEHVVKRAEETAEEEADSQIKLPSEQSKAWKRLLGQTSEQTAKKQKTVTVRTAGAENNLKDSVRPGLVLISIGLNPGIMTGKLGHAYAHPSNRYWPTLFASGITPVLHKPEETLSLMDLYGLGHTNIIPDKATVGGNDLTRDDYMDGAKVLDDKIRELKPEAVMIVGKGIWEAWFQYKRGRKMKKSDNFQYGWQDANLNVGRKNGVWDGAKTFVATTTSGLSSSHTTEQRVAIWKPMGDWFAPKRLEWVEGKQAGEREEPAAT